jgi:flavin-binding protein dodecin
MEKAFSNGRCLLKPLTVERRKDMAKGSTYTVIELVGTSDKSWEEAAKLAVETAAESLRDLRVAEVVKLDMTIEDGKVKSYRARVNVSFKYQKEK